jgi:hypothetical protein
MSAAPGLGVLPADRHTCGVRTSLSSNGSNWLISVETVAAAIPRQARSAYWSTPRSVLARQRSLLQPRPEPVRDRFARVDAVVARRAQGRSAALDRQSRAARRDCRARLDGRRRRHAHSDRIALKAARFDEMSQHANRRACGVTIRRLGFESVRARAVLLSRRRSFARRLRRARPPPSTQCSWPSCCMNVSGTNADL